MRGNKLGGTGVEGGFIERWTDGWRDEWKGGRMDGEISEE